ncbi:MAG: transposase [Candidatus Sulfotelmatobacter sp.]
MSQTVLARLFYSRLMTEALHRFYGGRDLNSLTFSCYQRQPFFNNAAHCDLFLTILERVRRRYRLVVLGYVVMPEHVHLLLSEPQRATLSTAIQALKLGVVRTLQIPNDEAPAVPTPRPRKPGETWGTPVRGSLTRKHFWQARFYDFNVRTEKKRIEKLRYIHRNPVARGLVASPELWRWSSFRWYSSGEVGPVRINDTDILVMTIRPPAA